MDEQDTGDHLMEIGKPTSLMDGGEVTDQAMRRRGRVEPGSGSLQLDKMTATHVNGGCPWRWRRL